MVNQNRRDVLRFGRIDSNTTYKINQRRGQDQRQETPIPPPVEHVAGNQQQHVLRPMRQDNVKSIHQGKEENENEGVEEQVF